MSADSGWRYLDDVYNPNWLHEHGAYLEPVPAMGLDSSVGMLRAARLRDLPHMIDHDWYRH